MYKKHSEIITPSRDIIIWRYLSLDKFLFMLKEENLYFARQDCFFDSFEGKRSNEDMAFYDKVIPNISKIIQNDTNGCGFINCWVMSNVELYLMWNTYSSIDKGIAIKSTIGHLIDALDTNDKRCIYISDVKYIDYTQDSTFNKAGGYANDLARYFCKRDYFQQEKELRLVYYDFKTNLNDNMKGLNFKISLDRLIDDIWIAPRAEEWYETLINDELKLHKLKMKVKRSLL